MEITMPVGGKDEVIDIPKKNINEIIMPLSKPGLPVPEEKIREAVMNPIGSKRLFPEPDSIRRHPLPIFHPV